MASSYKHTDPTVGGNSSQLSTRTSYEMKAYSPSSPFVRRHSKTASLNASTGPLRNARGHYCSLPSFQFIYGPNCTRPPHTSTTGHPTVSMGKHRTRSSMDPSPTFPVCAVLAHRPIQTFSKRDDLTSLRQLRKNCFS